MENAHQQDCAAVYLFRQVYLLPSNDFQDSKSWKNCVQGYVLKLAIKVAIQAALKEEAKNKDEETGVEYWSV